MQESRHTWMRCSVRLSRELVASSSSSSRGFFRIALATATRCFSPAPGHNMACVTQEPAAPVLHSRAYNLP